MRCDLYSHKKRSGDDTFSFPDSTVRPPSSNSPTGTQQTRPPSPRSACGVRRPAFPPYEAPASISDSPRRRGGACHIMSRYPPSTRQVRLPNRVRFKVAPHLRRVVAESVMREGGGAGLLGRQDDWIEAHIFIAFLAYCLHVTLGRRLKGLAPGLTVRSRSSEVQKNDSIRQADTHLPLALRTRTRFRSASAK